MRRAAAGAAFVDDVLALDARSRAARTSVENLKAEKNALTAQISKAADRGAEAQRLPSGDRRTRRADHFWPASRFPRSRREIDAILSEVPNLLDDSVPDGAAEADNVVVRISRRAGRFAFTPKPHWEIGEALGDPRFRARGEAFGQPFRGLARQRRAPLARARQLLPRSRRAAVVHRDFPAGSRQSRETMWSTGQLTKFADAMFLDRDADLFMIPTAEVPLTALHKDEILDGAVLPLQYTAYTPCFRKEAGAAGKDTRGLIRLHQFDKVELVWLTEPERSFEALEQLTRDAGDLLGELGLPYRVVALCAGDVGFNGAKTYDLEVWLPSQNAYREISSCSNCTDFQARRAAIRFRREPKAKPELVHTLNGSGLAVGRTLVGILENYQQADGSVRIPEALVPFTGFESIERERS